MWIVIASSLRLLVTLSSPRGPGYFLLPNTMNHSWHKFLAEPKDHNQSSWWVLDSMLWLCQFHLSAWVVRKKYVELVWHANPCIHNSGNHMFFWVVPLWLSFDLVYQFIVKSMRAFVYRCLLLLWFVKPFYHRMTRRNKLQYLFHI